MKLRSLLPVCALSLTSLGFADDSDWRYGLPDTGLTPSALSYEALMRADERHGHSSFGLQKFGLCVPLSDPRKTGYQRWLVSAELDTSLTELNTAGRISLDEETLYTINLPVAVVRSYESGNRLTLAVVPSLSSDMGHASGAFTVGAMANYRVVQSETLSYSFGLAYSQLYDRNGFLPLVGFNWDINSKWSLNMSRLELALEYHYSDRFKVGPYIGGMGNSWTIHHQGGQHWLRTQSILTGVKGQYNVDSTGKAKKVFDFAIGASVYTRVKVQAHSWSQNTELKEYYEPALYVSLGFDMRF